MLDKKIGLPANRFQPLPEGGVILHIDYASFDPYMRGRMRAKTIMPAYALNEPIPSTCVATVMKTANSDFPKDSVVRGSLAISEYIILYADAVTKSGLHLVKNATSLSSDVYLGGLGMPGLAAYSSFYEIGQPKAGETIFITAAAGAVGHMVGQIAKVEGLKVIGSTGSDDKVKWLKETVGFDDAFNYKEEATPAALSRLAPDGLDIYFDNAGGEQLDAALMKMKPFGRVIGCGMQSLYNKDQNSETYGLKGMFNLVVKRLSMRGFIVSDPKFGPAYQERFDEAVAGWIANGQVKPHNHITEGIDLAAEGFAGMLKGENKGKAVLKL